MNKKLLPEWLEHAISDAIAFAERHIKGKGKGPIKAALVKRMVKDLAKTKAAEHDIEEIPDWLENEAEPRMIDFAVDLIFLTMKRNGVLRGLAPLSEG